MSARSGAARPRPIRRQNTRSATHEAELSARRPGARNRAELSAVSAYCGAPTRLAEEQDHRTSHTQAVVGPAARSAPEPTT